MNDTDGRTDPPRDGRSGSNAGQSRGGRPWYEMGVMADPILDQVLLFYLGEARHGMSDVGEVLETASRVVEEDPASWAREWRATAERVRGAARTLEDGGHRRGAGEAYLRASTYFRAALHRHPAPASSEVPHLARAEIACFAKAIDLAPLPVRLVRIPYEGTTLPGYFWRSSVADAKAPVLIAHQGRDAWAEDNLFLAEQAIARGWHCLLFDGPGMGQVLRLQRLPFRPDWETVITPVVDWVLNQPGVDAVRIGLMGISMGGALAPRAAAFEKRLKVLVANPGVYQWSRVYSAFITEQFPEVAGMPEKDPEAFDTLMERVMAESPFMRWGLEDSMWKHGCATPAELMRVVAKYTNEGFAAMIGAKTLVVDGEAEEYGQARELFAALRCPKDYLLFTAEEAAPLHVQTGSPAVSCQRIFAWLEDNL
jgi:hypothetical protein